MAGTRLFLVDDDDTLRRVLSRELGSRGFDVEPFASAAGVVDAARRAPPQVALVDLMMPGVGGLELLAQLRALDPAPEIVVLTGHGSVAEAVEAMRRGAHDFLTKPARLDVLEQTLLRAAETQRLVESNARLRRAAGALPRSAPLLGDSPAMRALRQAIERVAASDASLLVQGENGTGKELVARSVHASGRRSEQPFVVVNCGAIPESLVESELFGHERGAFTGADRRRVGLFEAAHGGTLFLDELGELPITVQPALLRALQFGEVRPVGGERVRTVDARFVAATNRNLLEMVEQGAFREDLYYRITTLQIDVPPLRAHPEDIRLLATTFLARSTARLGCKIAFDEAALQRLQEHTWPGNVRELENVAERLAVMTDGAVIDAELVERHVLARRPVRGELPSLRLEELEKLAIVAALRRHGGDKKAAAAELGIAFKTLYNKLDRYGLRTRSEEQDASPRPGGEA